MSDKEKTGAYYIDPKKMDGFFSNFHATWMWMLIASVACVCAYSVASLAEATESVPMNEIIAYPGLIVVSMVLVPFIMLPWETYKFEWAESIKINSKYTTICLMTAVEIAWWIVVGVLCVVALNPWLIGASLFALYLNIRAFKHYYTDNRKTLDTLNEELDRHNKLAK